MDYIDNIRVDDTIKNIVAKVTKENYNSEYVRKMIFGLNVDGEPVLPEEVRISVIESIVLKAAGWSMKGRVEKYFKEQTKAFYSSRAEFKKEKVLAKGGNIQEFDEDTPYDRLNVGFWICNMGGIARYTDKGNIAVVSYTPITILQIFKNKETGEEKIRLAFCKNHRWEEITVNKSDISSATKIVKLSGVGINITSENAKLIVQYLSDTEGINEIPEIHSTSKAGWHVINDLLYFIPYDSGLVFDADNRFKKLCESITTKGELKKWQEGVTEVIRFGRIEPRIMLAASFASVLVHLTDSQSFLVHLFGETGGGKTVSLMLAASVWANPATASGYMGEWMTTTTALEARANTLNHLPMIMDDTAKVQKRNKGDFSETIYTLANMTGKERSNQDIGLRVTSSWRNCTLTSGEHPIIGENEQGGAVNRVVEIKADSGDMFAEPRHIVELITKNYGYAGIRFVEAVKLEIPNIGKRFDEAFKKCQKTGGTSKQAMAIANIILADEICMSADIYGCNGIADLPKATLNPEDFDKFIKKANDVSENERCYDYIMSSVSMNETKFEEDAFPVRWGAMVEAQNEVMIIDVQLRKLCQDGGYNCNNFIDWLDEHGLLRYTNKNKRTVQISGAVMKTRPRCYAIKLQRTAN